METTSKKDWTPLYTPGAIVIAGIVIGVAIFFALSSKGANTVPSGGSQPTVNVDVKDVKIADEPYLGKESAPPMVYWSDYQCPFCKKFETGEMQQIIKEYVDTGKLKLVFKDFSFLGPDSDTAALYGRAVWNLYPNKYFEWREAMYDAQDEEHGGFGDEASIVALTGKIQGIDAQKVKNSVASKKSAYQAMIDADREEGAKFGIDGTPGFVVGKKQIVGAQSISEFKNAIDLVVKK